jgi:hypothetical protein
MKKAGFYHFIKNSKQNYSVKEEKMNTRIMIYFLLLTLIAFTGNAWAGSEGNANTFYGHWAGYYTSGDDDFDTFIGAEAGTNNTSGYSNTFVGYYSGYWNTTGSQNTFVGYKAGNDNKQISGGWEGSFNVYIGDEAASKNTTGHSNTIIGREAGNAVSAYSYSTFIGTASGYNNTASGNVFIGYDAGMENTTGAANTFLGFTSGYKNTTGEFNTFLGDNAGYWNTTGSNNTFIGRSAGEGNTGGQNTFVGKNAGAASSATSYNTFVGHYAGYSNSTGEKNTFIGTASGENNNTGGNNTFLGVDTGKGNTSGTQNVFIGDSVGRFNNTGNNNTFVGSQAGKTSTGSGNVFLGNIAGYWETGSNKLFIDNSDTSTPLIYGEFDNDIVKINGKLGVGVSPTASRLTVGGVIESTTGGVKFPDGTTQTTSANNLQGVTNSTNSFYGQNAGSGTTSGVSNTYLGQGSGYMNSTGTGNVMVGYQAGYNETASNKLYIANSSTASPLIYGEFNNSLVRVNGNLYVTGNAYMTSDARSKENIEPIESSLNKVLGISGVRFQWKKGDNDNKGQEMSEKKHYGVVAQEIEKVLPEIVENGTDGNKHVAYMELIPVLIEAMKEQQKTIDTQQKTIADLSRKVTEVERELRLKGALASIDAK